MSEGRQRHVEVTPGIWTWGDAHIFLLLLWLSVFGNPIFLSFRVRKGNLQSAGGWNGKSIELELEGVVTASSQTGCVSSGFISSSIKWAQVTFLIYSKGNDVNEIFVN